MLTIASLAALATTAGGPANQALALPAGYFEVVLCAEADRYGYASDALVLARPTGVAVAGRDCQRYGRTRREGGVITRARVSSRRAPAGSAASAAFTAAPRTFITSLSWSGRIYRCDDAWAATLYASGGTFGRRALPVASQSCRAQSARFEPPRTFNVFGATRFGQGVRCVARRSCSARAAAGGARADVRTYGARIRIRDRELPGMSKLGGRLASGQWSRGDQPVAVAAWDNAGVQLIRAWVPGQTVGATPGSCNFSRRIPCSGTLRGVTARTGLVPREGTQRLYVDAIDSANNVRRTSFVARIDNGSPRAVGVSLDGGEGWRRHGRFVARWANAAEGDRAPIDGAYYQLRRAGTSAWGAPRLAGGEGLSALALDVPPGDWELQLWRRDQAGNQSPDSASVPVRLRHDPNPPQVALERPLPADPARLAAQVTDPISGLAGGEIELRREGESTWRVVPTRKEGGRLVADVDDATLPPGLYAIRARASDLAGNVGFGERRTDGFPAVIALPARSRTMLRAGILRRKGGRARLLGTARVRQGRRVVIAGRLRGAGGGQLQGAPLRLTEPGAGGELVVATLQTDARGRFRGALRATHNRVLRLRYWGTRTALPAERALILRVPAASRLRSSRRRLRNRQSVLFTGRVTTAPLPAAGKLVELQAHFRGRWRTFQTVRSDARGRWRFRYRFGATRGRVTYRFRALLPPESGYPYVRGRSRAVRVTVTGGQ